MDIDFAALSAAAAFLPPANAASPNQAPSPLSSYTPAHVVAGKKPPLANTLAFSKRHQEDVCLYTVTSTTISTTTFSSTSSTPPKAPHLINCSTITSFSPTHVPSQVLVASTPSYPPNAPSSLSVVNLSENSIVKSFPDVKGTIIDISSSPVDDRFITLEDNIGSLDVKVWDQSSSGCQACGSVSGSKGNSGGVAFDNSGAIFAVAINQVYDPESFCCIKLYDAMQQQTAFATFAVTRQVLHQALVSKGISPHAASSFAARACGDWGGNNCIEFNSGGDLLMVKGSGGVVVLVDAFKGNVSNVFTEHLDEVEVLGLETGGTSGAIPEGANTAGG